MGIQGIYVDELAKRHKFNFTAFETTMDIKDFIQWVKIIAQNIHRTLPSNVMLDDLVQDGMIGLIMAFRQHDADGDIPFKTFAGNKIRWAIMDGLRAGDWADKHVRGRANKVVKTTERLQALLHRQPSKKEIADELGVRVDDITTTLSEAYSYSFVRIDEGFHGETQDDSIQSEAQDIPDSRMEPSAIAERREIYSRAIAGLQALQPNERKAFILRIMCDMSGQQAATEMKLSESRVSQLYKTATEKLASYA
jgi:RNA polymerase sigma factor for flagellar operon FliA